MRRYGFHSPSAPRDGLDAVFGPMEHGPYVEYDMARAEIEKARLEGQMSGRLTGIRDAFAGLVNGESAKSDPRGPACCSCWKPDRSMAMEPGCQCSCHRVAGIHRPPEPKPLVPVHPKRPGTQMEQVTETVNALVDAVTELQRKVREVAPWLA